MGKMLTVTGGVNPQLKRLRKLAEFQPQDGKIMIRKMDVLFRRHEKKVFSTQGSAGGGKWPALTDRYRKWKNKNGGRGKKIMVLGNRRFGRQLRTGLTTKSGDHVARYRITGPTSIRFRLGTKDELAAYHIKPRRPPRFVKSNPKFNKRMPQRDTLAHSFVQLRKYTESGKEYLVKTKLPRLERALAAASKRRSRTRRSR